MLEDISTHKLVQPRKENKCLRLNEYEVYSTSVVVGAFVSSTNSND